MKTITTIAAMITLAATLAGCGGKEIVLVADQIAPAKLPAECVSGDRAWQDIPEADITQSEGARNYRANKRGYANVLHKRAVCRSAIKAAGQG